MALSHKFPNNRFVFGFAALQKPAISLFASVLFSQKFFGYFHGVFSFGSGSITVTVWLEAKVQW
jgi:hypothetical protein